MVQDLFVSVVVPTANGRDWRPAVASAYQQVEVGVEVILVNNGAREILPDHQFPQLRILRSDQALGANGARQLGVSAASHELVALLDDDDEWFPRKLIEQWRFVQATISNPMSSAWVCGAGQLIVEGGKDVLYAPARFVPEIEDAATYLFVRKSLRSPSNQLQSSTLIFPKHVATSVPFDSRLALHQDWTWILDVEDKLSAAIMVCPRYLVRYHKSGLPGITRSTKFYQSLDWAASRLSSQSPRIKGDFLLTVPFNMALENGSLKAALRIFLKAMYSHRPGVPAVSRAILVILRVAGIGMRERIDIWKESSTS